MTLLQRRLRGLYSQESPLNCVVTTNVLLESDSLYDYKTHSAVSSILLAECSDLWSKWNITSSVWVQCKSQRSSWEREYFLSTLLEHTWCPDKSERFELCESVIYWWNIEMSYQNSITWLFSILSVLKVSRHFWSCCVFSPCSLAAETPFNVFSN